MVRHHDLVESRPSVIQLEDAEAVALQEMGERLASKAGWWGDEDDEDDSFAPPSARRSVIAVHRIIGSTWSVRVSDAVGVAGVGDVQLTIKPKIPEAHL